MPGKGTAELIAFSSMDRMLYKRYQEVVGELAQVREFYISAIITDVEWQKSENWRDSTSEDQIEK